MAPSSPSDLHPPHPLKKSFWFRLGSVILSSFIAFWGSGCAPLFDLDRISSGCEDCGGSGGTNVSDPHIGSGGTSALYDPCDFNLWDPACENINRFFEEFSEATCTALDRCAPLEMRFFGGAESCPRLLNERFRAEWYSTINEAVADEKVIYFSTLAELCVASVFSADCDSMQLFQQEHCIKTFEGLTSRGDACTRSEECLGDSICVFGKECPGTCQSRFDAGEPCESDSQCSSGLVCSRVTDRCVVPAGRGEACEGTDEPQCAFPLLCLGGNTETGTPGTCYESAEVLTGGLDEPCDFLSSEPSLCQVDLSCVLSIDKTGLTSRCRPPAGPAEPCGPALPEMCPVGHFCAGLDPPAGDLEGNCAPLPEQDEPCADGLLQSCQPGHTCEDGTCTSLKNNGESCGEDAHCLSGNCQDGGCAPLGECYL